MSQPKPPHLPTPSASTTPALDAAALAYTESGIPYAPRYDDIYHSTDGGLAQAAHVFIAGNQLPARWQNKKRFTILETGFGLGLSFLATWQAWRADPLRARHLHFISTELHPFSRSDLRALHQQWPELEDLAAELQANWPPLTPGFHHLLLDHGQVSLTLLFGDAHTQLTSLRAKVDAFYFDGFAPDKNPALWSPTLLGAASKLAAIEATCATWCVAGSVRRVLKDLAWSLEKLPGFAHKRHMLFGVRESAADQSKTQSVDAKNLNAQSIETHNIDTLHQQSKPLNNQTINSALIIGAGIAGCSMAEALLRRDWHVTLIEQHTNIAQEASGNPAGLLHPMLARDDNLAARLSRAGYLYSLRLLRRLSQSNNDVSLEWSACGIIHLAETTIEADEQRSTCEKLKFPSDFVSVIDQATASRIAGLTVGHSGWWFPEGAWVNPPSLCAKLLAEAHTRERVEQLQKVSAKVERIAYVEAHQQWQAYDAAGELIASASHLVLANASAAQNLLPEIELTLRRIRGQISYLPLNQASTSPLKALQVGLCGSGYIAPPSVTHTNDANAQQTPIACLGASFVEDDADTTLRISEHQENLRHLNTLLPSLHLDIAPETLAGRVAFRSATHDRMPIAGQLPIAALKESHQLENLPRQAGLFALLGLGSRGLVWGPLLAELVAAQMNDEAIPIEQALCKVVDPARFHLRKVRKAANQPTLTQQNRLNQPNHSINDDSAIQAQRQQQQ